jgi:hypothetical protein
MKARATQLLKLGVERLPVGADAGIAEAAVLQVSSGHICATHRSYFADLRAISVNVSSRLERTV